MLENVNHSTRNFEKNVRFFEKYFALWFLLLYLSSLRIGYAFSHRLKSLWFCTWLPAKISTKITTYIVSSPISKSNMAFFINENRLDLAHTILNYKSQRDKKSVNNKTMRCVRSIFHKPRVNFVQFSLMLVW